MALETLTVQSVSRAGAEMSLQSVTTVGGFRFLNDGKTIMYVEEKNTANCEVGIIPTQKVDSQSAAVKTVDVTSDKNFVLGPWAQDQYNDASGYANFTIEADQASAVGLVSFL